MNAPNSLETTGNLKNHPFAELLVEIAQVRLNGSLRASFDAQKIAVYFDAGEIVFAASNARQHRLYEILLQNGRMTKNELVTIPEFTNDLALKEHLLKHENFSKEEFSVIVSQQIYEIVKTAIVWQTGEWTFSPLVRIKGDLRFPIVLQDLLLNYARNLPAAEITRRLSKSQEPFGAKTVTFGSVALSPKESFVYSRFEDADLKILEVQTISGLPETETQQIIYALWLGGLLVRQNWHSAFSEKKITAILAARLTLKKEETAKPPAAVLPASPAITSEAETENPDSISEEIAPIEKTLTLEKYLERIEKAQNFYEFFALAPNAPMAEIKRIYFNLAKRFHPDLYHKESDDNLVERIQSAFSKLANAYDTLKTDESRELYDFRVRKELAEIKAVQEEKITPEEIDSQRQSDQAAESFQHGFGLLMENEDIAAIPFLARAVHFAGQNARYHAYYGKALMADKKHRHQAESELQTAIKLDNQNADYRIMLAEFFIFNNLFKRAEGELNRLLAIVPNHREAKRLLDSLQKK